MSEGDRTAKEPAVGVVEKAKRIRFVLLDADGVLTDGRLYGFRGGEDGRAFHVRDGFGIRLGQLGGLRFGILSGRVSPVVAERAAELDFVEVRQGSSDKEADFLAILSRLDLEADAVCYVGDDLLDVPVLRRAGLGIAPADADPEARRAADWVASRGGGAGVVREVTDLLLRAQGSWERITAKWLAAPGE